MDMVAQDMHKQFQKRWCWADAKLKSNGAIPEPTHNRNRVAHALAHIRLWYFCIPASPCSLAHLLLLALTAKV